MAFVERVRTKAVTPAARPMRPAASPNQPAVDAASLDVVDAAADGAGVTDGEDVGTADAAASLAVVTNEGAGCSGSGCPSTVFSSHFTTVPSV